MNAPQKKETKKHGILEAQARKGYGKGAARSLRRDGQVPGIVYSKGSEPMSIALNANQLRLEYMRGRFRSRLVEITIDGKTMKALPKDLQFHPVSDVIEHVDFIRVEAGVALRVSVPVKFVNQDKSPGLKRGGVLNVVRHEIEFTAMPEAIPTHIEVNLEGLEIGNSVHINDVKLPAGITPTIKRNFTVAAVAGRAAEEEEVKPVTAAVEGAEGAAAVPGAEGAAAAPGAAPAAGAAGAAAPAAAAGKDAGKKEEKKK